MPFAIKVIDLNGDEEYLCDGTGYIPTRFSSCGAAQEYADFLRMGIEGDVQSINIVPYPRKERTGNGIHSR